MSVLGHVFDTLAAMSLLQLLLAFMGCMGYALAQGGLLASGGRQLAGATAVGAAVAFTLLFITLHLAAMRNEIMRRRVRTLMLTQAERA